MNSHFAFELLICSKCLGKTFQSCPPCTTNEESKSAFVEKGAFLGDF